MTNRAGLWIALVVCSGLCHIAAQNPSRGPVNRNPERRIERSPELDWKNPPEFERDVFTFVRIEYDSYGRRRWRGRGPWETDWPDSDLNFSYRLQQLTALKVDPDPISMRLTDPRLYRYPFIYIVEPGGLVFREEEVTALRRYLLNGGFLMVDDFWGEDQWNQLASQMRRVFPDREPVELPVDHELFHLVYDLEEKPQVPSINVAWSGRTFERWDAQEPHFRAIHDDQQRIMVLICHNTDLGDGWEREGVDEWYFREFSEKKAYPMGINIVTYAMTH